MASPVSAMATLKRWRTLAISERMTPRLLFREWLAERWRVILETATYMRSVRSKSGWPFWMLAFRLPWEARRGTWGRTRTFIETR